MGHRISVFLQCFKSWKRFSENRAEARPLLAVGMPVSEFKCCAPNNQLFSWLVLMQVISVSCADFSVSVWVPCIFEFISVFCSMKCHYFLRPSSQVPSISFLSFLICQHLSFVNWCFSRVLISFCTAFKPWSLTQQNCSLKLTMSIIPSDSKLFPRPKVVAIFADVTLSI